MNKIRIDKWLWSVRIFKTRSNARNACLKGKIKINGQSVKPSYSIEVKKIIEVRKRFINYKFKVIGLTDKRVGAKLLQEYLIDLTSKEELDKKKINFSLYTSKTRKGRPTKKERRDMEKLKSKFNDQ